MTSLHPDTASVSRPGERFAIPRPPRTGGARPSVEVLSGVEHVALGAFDLLVRRKSGVPMASLGLYVPRVVFDPPGKAGQSALATRSAIRGAGDFDAAGLAFAFERLGGTLSPSISLDWVGIGTSVLAVHLGEAVALLDVVLTAPRYEDEQVLAERKLLVDETTQIADDMFRYPFQLALATAYGDRGYGVPALGLPDDIGRVTPDDVRAWHQQTFLGPRGVILAVGDFDPEDTLADLVSVFGRHPSRIPAPLSAPVEWAVHGETSTRITMREKTQSAFAMAFPGPSRRDRARYAADVWSAVASGLGGRLFDVLRDRRSLAYSVLASSWQKARSGAFLAYIATSPEREAEARAGMLEELRRFGEELVTPEELSQATSYLAGQTEVNRQSTSAVAGEILEAWLAGDGLADLADPAARYRAVTAADIREVAARSLGQGAGLVHAEGVVRGSGGGR